jgi:TolA-binding protein
MKTIDFTYFIEKYNANEMDPAEKAWFEKELNGDSSLQKEVHLRKKTDVILEHTDIISLRNKLTNIEKARRAEVTKSGNIKNPRFRYAAVFTGLIILGSLLYLSFNTQSTKALYDKYCQVYKYPANSRSANISFDKAIDCLNNKEYARALDGFRDFLSKNPGSPKIEFLSGISYLGLSEYANAESSFSKVINAEVNLYTEQANWYLAMCYLATDDKLSAREQLRKIARSESVNKNKAKSILRHL